MEYINTTQRTIQGDELVNSKILSEYLQAQIDAAKNLQSDDIWDYLQVNKIEVKGDAVRYK